MKTQYEVLKRHFWLIYLSTKDICYKERKLFWQISLPLKNVITGQIKTSMVNKGEWLWSPENIKGANKDTKM